MRKLVLFFILFLISQLGFSQNSNNPDSVCLNSSSEIYWITPNLSSSYNWTVDPSIGIMSTSYDPVTNIFTIDWSGVISGLYQDAITVTETDSNNCLGQVTLDVRVLDLPSAPSVLDVIVCENNIIPPLTATGTGNLIWYDANGNQVYIGNSFQTPHILPGIYTYSVSDELNGCEGLSANVSLTINSISTGVDIQTACDTYTWIDGNTYNSSNNTATHTLTNIVGCDSIVTLNLTINNITTGVDVQTACDTYTWIDGNTYTSSNNIATHTLTNASVNGCDSIVTLNLTINSSNTGVDIQTACDTYTWIDGTTYTSSNNTATHTLTNVAGCDSIVTLNLIINNSTTGVDVQTACDTYTWIDGTTYTSSNNTATHTLTNASVNGCDSIVILDLTIINTPPAPSSNTVTSCENGIIDPLNANGIGVLSWFDTNGNQVATGSPFNTGISLPGTYTFSVVDILNGCISNATQVDLIIHPAPNPGLIQHN